MRSVQKILAIQGDHRVALLKAGLSDEKSLAISSDVVQAFLNAKIFSEEVQNEIDMFLNTCKEIQK